jgi:glycerophosphoryl diester phosphodiesterase
MDQSLTPPVIFAHRGASSHAPENTLAAFQLAIDQGAKAIELDVQLTKDHEVIVFHDVFLHRLTNRTGKVKDLTLGELKALNTGLSFSPAYQNQTIPTLEEVLDYLPDEIFINIELKNLHAPFDDLPGKTASIIAAKKAQSRVLISSFNTAALLKMSLSINSLPLGLLLRSSIIANLRSIVPRLHKKFYSIHLAYSCLNPQLLAIFKSSGAKVFTYTLNHTQDILSAVNMGVDGFFTDDPGFAYRVLLQNGLLINDRRN